MANYPCKTVSAASFVLLRGSLSICKSRYCVQWIQSVSLWYCADLILWSLCMVRRPQSSDGGFRSLFKSGHCCVWASVSFSLQWRSSVKELDKRRIRGSMFVSVVLIIHNKHEPGSPDVVCWPSDLQRNRHMTRSIHNRMMFCFVLFDFSCLSETISLLRLTHLQLTYLSNQVHWACTSWCKQEADRLLWSGLIAKYKTNKERLRF